MTATLDVGGSTVAYDEFLQSAVLSLVPAVRFDRGRATVLLRGSYSRFESGSESFQGSIAASVVSPAVWGIRGEIGGAASNTRYRGAQAATNALVTGRLHWASVDQGVWIGGSAGAVAQSFFFPDNVYQATAGAWIRRGSTALLLDVSPTQLGDSSFTDAVLSLRWQRLRGELSASAGYRSGVRASGAAQWAELGGAFWMTRRLALVGGVGAFPADLVQGVPGGRYAAAALRIASRPPTTNDARLRAELTLPYELSRLRRDGSEARRFVLHVEADGTRTIRVRVPGARLVELMADFTDWLPVPLSPVEDGNWALNLFVAPGVHRVNVRVDGGPWFAPPGLTAVRDEFGGEIGLLVVQ